MHIILLTLFIIIIIVILIILYYRIRYFDCPDTSSYSYKNYNNNYIHSINPKSINAKVYIGNSYQNFPEKEYIKQKNPVGLAFSGGGSRAMCATWGILQALYKQNMLNNNTISYISAVSGSTWAVLPVLYQSINRPNYNIDDILGSEFVDFSQPLTFPIIGYNAVHSNFKIFDNDKWWPINVGTTFFEPYGLDTSLNQIIGINNTTINTILSELGANYNGIILRENMPIPIAMQTMVNIVETVWYRPNEYIAIPLDSTPISTGFIGINRKISNSQCSDLEYIGGRIDSYGFNSIINSSIISTSNTYDISLNLQSNTWDLKQMSGSSSMAPGFDILKDTASLLDKYVPDYTISLPITFPINKSVKIVDGGCWDNTGVTSLLARGVTKVAIFIQSDYLPSQWSPTFGTEDIANLFGVANNFYSDYHGQYDAQVFDNSNNEYITTLNGIISNYTNEGIAYYKDTYQTINNYKSGIIPYSVNVLWYILSPAKQFIDQLSDKNKTILNNIQRFPNICTALPYINDCNENQQCNSSCPSYSSASDLFNIYLNSSNINTVTNTEAICLCAQSSWICKKILIPFLQQ